ncbi:heme ABC transporter ATP-binding protein [Vibrio genomosp. F10]|uniref:heme ABC transporter ATP-binding protein n=1 Tax=Vibrio genomosp. F10 TaxID=723171 RepID=UPI0003806B51|nr:heme ABC transporter ATP-binding protein [Vibrio genomosp. F10]OEF08455.1 heme ABC transporter ATP-binding protein [Vibrio genomosp. F10 str. 9ZB36]
MTHTTAQTPTLPMTGNNAVSKSTPCKSKEHKPTNFNQGSSRHAISLSNLSLTLGKKVILDKVSTHINTGELTILLGPNGTGKSSLLKMITGEYPSQGGIEFFDCKSDQWSPQVLAKHLGVLPQSSSLSFNFSAKEVVELGGIPLAESAKRISDIAAKNMRLTDTAHLADRMYPSLSGGEKQRVHFARVLTQLAQSEQQTILLLDEPTSALDLSHQHQTLSLAKTLTGQGAAVVIVMHDLNLAAQYADRVMILNKGNIVADGTPWDVLTKTTIEDVYNFNVTVIEHPHDDYPVLLS